MIRQAVFILFIANTPFPSGSGVIRLAEMRKKIDAILIHADYLLLGTLGKEFVKGFGHS